MRIDPYLNFPGTTEEAFNFYKSIFGGEFPMIMRFKDMPESDKIPAEYHDKITHISLPIGNNVLMATDAIEGVGSKLIVGNNNSVCLTVDSKEEADRIFGSLMEGGKIEMPLADQFWGDYFGSGADKYGIQWMVAFGKANN